MSSWQKLGIQSSGQLTLLLAVCPIGEWVGCMNADVICLNGSLLYECFMNETFQIHYEFFHAMYWSPVVHRDKKVASYSANCKAYSGRTMTNHHHTLVNLLLSIHSALVQIMYQISGKTFVFAQCEFATTRPHFYITRPAQRQNIIS